MKTEKCGALRAEVNWGFVMGRLGIMGIMGIMGGGKPQYTQLTQNPQIKAQSDGLL